MTDIKDRIVKNINSLVMMLRSQGIKQLSATKFLLFLNNHYDVQLDQEALEDILNDNKSVIEFDKDKVIIGEPEEENEEEEADEAVHDMAVDQAAGNLSMESVQLDNVLKIFENIHVGDEIDPRDVILEENDINYHLNNGAKKSKSTYIVTELLPQKTLKESKVRCKIKGNYILIDLPITSLI